MHEVMIESVNMSVVFEELTTEEIIGWPQKTKVLLESDLSRVIGEAFPRMPEEDCKEFLGRFFIVPGRGSSRKVLLVRDSRRQLAAVSLFDHTQIEFQGNSMEAIYLNLRAIVPSMQNLGIGRKIAARVLINLKPDILMTTCTQSSSLHSWISLPSKGMVKGFHVYPHVTKEENIDLVLPLPYPEIPLVVSAFEHMYLQILNSDRTRLTEAMNNLTVRMVRRNVHHGMYDFQPWEKEGRIDPVALALGLTERDGVLVVFRKRMSLPCYQNSTLNWSAETFQ